METKLIEQLAQRLGTTTEYLWSVLLKQAPIDATITLLQVILVIIGGIVIYRIHKYLSNDENKMSYYNDEPMIAVMLSLCLVWCILAIACFFCISDIINGYFNPEFWALNKILRYIKS